MRVFRLGYCRHGLLAGRIAIPIHNARGELIAYCGRWLGEPPVPEPKYKLPRGFRKSLELFNLHRAKQADARLPLVVVEGYFGCMRVWQAGHRRVVALMGSSLSASQQELIERTAGPGGRVIILFDEDEAGRKGRAEARERLSELLEVRAPSLGHEGTQPEHIAPDTLLELIQQAASAEEAP
jgi:DNA primase